MAYGMSAMAMEAASIYSKNQVPSTPGNEPHLEAMGRLLETAIEKAEQVENRLNEMIKVLLGECTPVNPVDPEGKPSGALGVQRLQGRRLNNALMASMMHLDVIEASLFGLHPGGLETFGRQI